ncbi:MAG: mannose-1-phosphate guanylyltransferase, partial [Prevotella sp.]|nr:mannose-1-phosphate guanylyltransferase [Prevotella sp.]
NTRSRILADDSMHNVVALPDGKFAVLSGLNGYIVAEKDDVLLVCKKEDTSACVRKLLSRIENEDGLEGYI